MTDQKHTPEPSGPPRPSEPICPSCGNSELRRFERRYPNAVACVNALAGIDDPEAFMRDVHRRFSVDWILSKHLKGGT